LTIPTFVVGWPSDDVGVAAFVIGAVALGAAALLREPWSKLAGRVSPRHFVVGAAVGAALLSAGYIAYYLRGGPRIVDATSYFLEARALAQGNLAFDVPDPSGSFCSRRATRSCCRSVSSPARQCSSGRSSVRCSRR
jgi:hypothetical protein